MLNFILEYWYIIMSVILIVVVIYFIYWNYKENKRVFQTKLSEEEIKEIVDYNMKDVESCKSLDIETNLEGDVLNMKFYDSKLSEEEIKEICKGYSGGTIERVRRNMTNSRYGIMFEPVDDNIEKYKDEDEVMELNTSITTSMDIVFLVSELISLKGGNIVYNDLVDLKDVYMKEEKE